MCRHTHARHARTHALVVFMGDNEELSMSLCLHHTHHPRLLNSQAWRPLPSCQAAPSPWPTSSCPPHLTTLAGAPGTPSTPQCQPGGWSGLRILGAAVPLIGLPAARPAPLCCAAYGVCSVSFVLRGKEPRVMLPASASHAPQLPSTRTLYFNWLLPSSHSTTFHTAHPMRHTCPPCAGASRRGSKRCTGEASPRAS